MHYDLYIHFPSNTQVEINVNAVCVCMCVHVWVCILKQNIAFIMFSWLGRI